MLSSLLKWFASSRPGNDVVELVEFQKELRRCCEGMLYYEYTEIYEQINFGRLISPWDGRIKKQYEESREWLRMRLELTEKEFRRRGLQPRSFPTRPRELGSHAWNVTEPTVKTAWDIS